MNYLKEINTFYDWLETNSLSDSAIVLWHALMHINNRAGWITEFAVAVSILEIKTGLKKDAIFRARLRLQQVGRIDFKSRSGQQSAMYTLIPFDSEKTTQSLIQDDSGVLSDTNRDANSTQTATQSTTQSASITKLNKTKLNKTINNVNYAEFVSMTEDEYAKLVNEYGEDMTKKCIEVLDNYKGSSGKKYKSDYRTMLNWVVKRVVEDGKTPITGKGNDNAKPRAFTSKSGKPSISIISVPDELGPNNDEMRGIFDKSRKLSGKPPMTDWEWNEYLAKEGVI